MTPKIYRSTFLATDIPECNVYEHVLPQADKDAHPEDAPLFVDAETGLTLNRGELRLKTLELAHGLKEILHEQYGGPKLQRGDTVLVFRCMISPLSSLCLGRADI